LEKLLKEVGRDNRYRKSAGCDSCSHCAGD
jgi:hypothetical protein